MERPRGTAAAVPPLRVPRRPRSARPRSTRTRRSSPHAAGASVSTATRDFAPSRVRAMFFPRLSWLSRPRRRASTDSAASRALHVTSDGTGTAPHAWELRDWLTRTAYLRWWAGRRRGPRGSRGEVAGWSSRPGEWVSGRGLWPLGEGTLGPPPARLGLASALCSRALSQLCALTTSGLPAAAWFAILAPGRPEMSLEWKDRKEQSRRNLSSLQHLSRTFRCFEVCN